jgi:CubicO group peptidase (beta-lactamase class C family)
MTRRKTKNMPPVCGHVAPGWEPVRKAFRENFASRAEIGAAVAVQHRGEMVVDLWAGLRDARTGDPWEEDTMVLVFSATKGVSALVVAYAQSRGWLDYDAPVAAYWPAFARHGKAAITVRQLLSHQAGLHAFHARVDRSVIADPDRLARIMEDERPQWPPGDRHAYHIMSLGFFEGELIRRVDPRGRSLGTILRDDLAGPLGADFHIRVPADLPDSRLARLVMPGILRSIAGLPPRMVPAVLSPWSHVFRSAMINPGTTVAADRDRIVLREVEVPAGGGVGTARGLARLYGEFATGGKALGLRPETLAALRAPARAPRKGTRDMSLKVPVCYSLGFMKPFPGCDFGSPSAFGAPGAGGSMGFADPERQLGYGYVMNRMGTGLSRDPRERALHAAVLEVLG